VGAEREAKAPNEAQHIGKNSSRETGANAARKTPYVVYISMLSNQEEGF
jgi:hypothetical protein